MVQLADLFSVPEMVLICNVADYFDRNHIDYHPEILFRDIQVLLCWLGLVVAMFFCFCRVLLETPTL